MQFFRWLLLFLFFISSLSIANQTIQYEPESVELTGIVKKLHFPGPPNYESIKNGDKDEYGPYLILQNPIDVTSTTKSDIDTPEKNVKIIQLVIENKNDWKKIQEGNEIQASGTLFHSFTGHHHTRVLLDVNNVKVNSKNNNVNQDKINAIVKEDEINHMLNQ